MRNLARKAPPIGERGAKFVGVVLAALLLGACAGGETVTVGDPPVERVLIVSLPGVSWKDVQAAHLSHLEDFVDDAAIADMSTRVGRRNATVTDGYLTISAGTRAMAPPIDRAVALDPNESYGGVPAEEIAERRRGSTAPGIFYLGIGGAIDTNESSLYGGTVGLLGEELARHGVARAVVANADAVEGFVTEEPPPEGTFARSAATAVMTADGIVPDGVVGRSLLMDDPEAPFGWRLDSEAVLAAFAEPWDSGERTVALVEASDLNRADAYASRATPAQGRRLRSQALAEADELLGRLLERTDPERDAVLVISPSARRSQAPLGIVALRAPGVEPRLLESPTTRRAGYVQLADLTPTVLALLGEEAPDSIEGRGFVVAGDRAASDTRIDRLVDAADAAKFRDRLLPIVVVAIIAALALLTLAVLLRGRLPATAQRWMQAGAFAALGIVPATFVASRVGIASDNALGYAAVLVVIAALFAVAGTAMERQRPGLGTVAAVGAIVGFVSLDVLLGAELQVNSVFGYSLAVAGRFAGVGNLAFALFGSATILLAVLLADRGWSRGRILAVALLAAVVLVEGLPMLGADVGGILSMVPAFGVTVLVLSGRHVGFREGVLLAGATCLALLGFAFVDAARPARSQTHLARLAEHVLDGRWGQFFDSLSRRFQASFGGPDMAAWVIVGGVAAATGIYVLCVTKRWVGPEAPSRDRTTVAAVAGLSVLAGVGLVANDSSFAVPATMLIVVVPVFVLRALSNSSSDPPPERRRAGRTVQQGSAP